MPITRNLTNNSGGTGRARRDCVDSTSLRTQLPSSLPQESLPLVRSGDRDWGAPGVRNELQGSQHSSPRKAGPGQDTSGTKPGSQRPLEKRQGGVAQSNGRLSAVEASRISPTPNTAYPASYP